MRFFMITETFIKRGEVLAVLARVRSTHSLDLHHLGRQSPLQWNLRPGAAGPDACCFRTTISVTLIVSGAKVKRIPHERLRMHFFGSPDAF